jgi:hypothetical protein
VAQAQGTGGGAVHAAPRDAGALPVSTLPPYIVPLRRWRPHPSGGACERASYSTRARQGRPKPGAPAAEPSMLLPVTREPRIRTWLGCSWRHGRLRWRRRRATSAWPDSNGARASVLSGVASLLRRLLYLGKRKLTPDM